MYTAWSAPLMSIHSLKSSKLLHLLFFECYLLLGLLILCLILWLLLLQHECLCSLVILKGRSRLRNDLWHRMPLIVCGIFHVFTTTRRNWDSRVRTGRAEEPSTYVVFVVLGAARAVGGLNMVQCFGGDGMSSPLSILLTTIFFKLGTGRRRQSESNETLSLSDPHFTELC